MSRGLGGGAHPATPSRVQIILEGHLHFDNKNMSGIKGNPTHAKYASLMSIGQIVLTLSRLLLLRRFIMNESALCCRRMYVWMDVCM
jgi:hypothetical protein